LINLFQITFKSLLHGTINSIFDTGILSCKYFTTTEELHHEEQRIKITIFFLHHLLSKLTLHIYSTSTKLSCYIRDLWLWYWHSHTSQHRSSMCASGRNDIM